jgi:hypothetical protein
MFIPIFKRMTRIADDAHHARDTVIDASIIKTRENRKGYNLF